MQVMNHDQSESVGFGVCQVGLKCVYKKKPYRPGHHRELISESDSDTHSSEDKDISAQNDSDTGDTTDTNFKQWTENTNCQTTVPVVHKVPVG